MSVDRLCPVRVFMMTLLQDVARAVLFSRRHSLGLSVRSGGHSYICTSLKVPSHLNRGRHSSMCCCYDQWPINFSVKISCVNYKQLIIDNNNNRNLKLLFCLAFWGKPREGEGQGRTHTGTLYCTVNCPGLYLFDWQLQCKMCGHC